MNTPNPTVTLPNGNLDLAVGMIKIPSTATMVDLLESPTGTGWEYSFTNGLGASVVPQNHGSDLFQLAALKGGEIAPLIDGAEVHTWLTRDEVVDLLNRIAELS